jgi:hypothetical protein
MEGCLKSFPISGRVPKRGEGMHLLIICMALEWKDDRVGSNSENKLQNCLRNWREYGMSESNCSLETWGHC